MKTYLVYDIYEADFGCEGTPEGKGAQCEVLLKDEDGGVIKQLVADSYLLDSEINVGDRVCIGEDGIIEKTVKREYKFYGWEKAHSINVNQNVKEGKYTLLDMYDDLAKIWCAETCAPRMRDGWTKENMTMGQCSITSFLIQDIFGGDVYGLITKRGSVHCYNVIDGIAFDLTSEQFGDEAKELVYEGNQIQDRNSDIHFGKEEKHQRYRYLKEQFEAVL